MGVAGAIPLLLLQTVWVVDDNGGPGVNFTDLPPAVAAAADGDALVVMPGTYSHFTLAGKGLRILDSGAGSTVVASNLALTGWKTTISGGAASSVTYVDRIQFTGPAFTGPDTRVTVTGSATQATFADVDFSGPGPGAPGHALTVVGAQVKAIRCSIQGGSGGPSFIGGESGRTALLVQSGADVHVASSVVLAGNGGGTYPTCGSGTGGHGGDGAAVSLGSQLWVADSVVRGGNPGCCNSAAFCTCGNGGAGISVSSSFLRVSGDASAMVEGGDRAGNLIGPVRCSSAGAGILASGASGQVHSVNVAGGCTWTSSACSPTPPVSGCCVTLNLTPLPILEIGGTLTTTGSATVTFSNGPPNAPFLIAVSLAPGHAPAGPLFLGEILIDPVNWFLLLSRTLSAVGGFSVTIPLNGIAPSFAYAPIYLQGIALDPGGAFWRVSNATVATLRP